MGKTLKKGTRVTGAERDKLAAELKERYNAGESIRALKASTGYSYGFIHRILTESGVTLRGRGGAARGKDAGSSSRRGASESTTTKTSLPYSGAKLRQALANTQPPDERFAADIGTALDLLSGEEDPPWAGG